MRYVYGGETICNHIGESGEQFLEQAVKVG